MGRPARVLAVLLAACALASVLLVAAATPPLCARPVDVGSALRELVEDDAGATPPPTRAAARDAARPEPSLAAVGDGSAVAERLRPLRRLSRAHAIRYPAHTALASYLEALRCSPVAVAAQWLRAAFHARTAAEAVRAGDGIARAAARDPAGVATASCALEPTGQRALFRHAVNRAGIVCPGQSGAP